MCLQLAYTHKQPVTPVIPWDPVIKSMRKKSMSNFRICSAGGAEGGGGGGGRGGVQIKNNNIDNRVYEPTKILRRRYQIVVTAHRHREIV